MIQLAGWIGGLVVILVPGYAVASLLGTTRRHRGVVTLAMAVAAGLTFWPVAFLWSTLIGFRWSGAGVRVAVLALMVIAAVQLGRAFRRSARRAVLAGWRFLALFAALFGITIATRILHVRGIVAPLWVDSVHHTMVIRLLLEGGTIPSSYEPFIPNSVFYYHWGFHVNAAAAAWLTGTTSPFDVAQLLLGFGQFLNALVFVAMYAAGRVLFGSRSAGLLAATLACLVSYFPAYYVSWGRYTHLAGILLLAPFGISLYRAAHERSHRAVMELGFLCAGLALIHVRIAVFAATLAVAMLAVLFHRGALKIALQWGMAAALGAVLVSPWIARLAKTGPVHRLVSPPAAERTFWETPNVVPADLLWAPNNVPLMVLGTGGAIAFVPRREIGIAWRVAAMAWWTLLAFAFYRRWERKSAAPHGFRWRMLLLVVWSAITVAIINTQWIGLPRIRPLPNSAALITMFIPLSLLASGFIIWFARTAGIRRTGVAVLTILIAIAGAVSMRQVVNPVTVLVHEPDLRALRWIRDNTPPSAKFAVGAQPWLPGAYAGVDGGYWIPILTDRRSILPPGLYPWTIEAEELRRVNRTLATWAAAEMAPDEAVDATVAAGVTHAYFGPANRSAMRQYLSDVRDARRVYDAGGATIFQLRAR